MNNPLRLIGIFALLCYAANLLTKIKIQNKEVFSLKKEGEIQVTCVLILEAFLYGVVYYYVGFFADEPLSPSQKDGINWLVFLIVSANIIYILYQVWNKNLYALVQYIVIALFILILICLITLTFL